MTRKDYVLIAAAIARSRGHWSYNDLATAAIDRTAEQIAINLAADNPRFDRERFLEACKASDIIVTDVIEFFPGIDETHKAIKRGAAS